MRQDKTGKSERLARNAKRGLLLLAVVPVLMLLAISCGTVHRTVVLLPNNVPGANYIGSKECEQCHEKIYKDFTATADHARMIAKGANGIEAGCESCHGPCSLHSDSGGDTKPPYSFTSGRANVGSFDSHTALESGRARETVCLNCHSDVRAHFNLPNHHPVPEGKLTCTGCHPPHKGSAFTGGGTSTQTANEACTQCHAAQRGPFIFEHDAMREGCTTCHNPHGSVNAKLLTVRDSNLCLKCHFQRTSGGRLLIGGSDHTLRVQQGTCWTSGCHEAIHGSRVSSSLRF